MKIAIVYDTKTQTTEKAAEFIREGIENVGIEAKCFNVKSVDNEYIEKADGVIIGSPTYMASVTANLMVWLQTSASKFHLGGKLGGAFATEKYIHGGAENALTTIITHELVYGMMIYSSGCACGKPTIHLGPVGMSQNIEDFKELFIVYGERFANQLEKFSWERSE